MAVALKRIGLPVAALVLVLVGGVAATLHGTVATRAATAISGLHVSGNQILNAAGQPVRPLGVNRAGTEYECDASGNTLIFDGPSDSASVTALASWHVNAVRMPLNEDCWLGINGYPAGAYTAAQYQQAIVNYVNLLNASGILVILDLHWNAAGTQKSNAQQPMPDADHAPAFWASVANAFKGNSSVIFDLYNEPFTTSWSCWRNGSSAPSASPCTDVGFAVAGMQTLVNTVRATGATNVIMLGGLAYSNNLSSWLASEPSDPQHNLAASFHLYNNNTCANSGCWDSQVATVAAQVPVVTGELGELDCAHAFVDTAMSWLDQHNIGYLGWAWDVYSCGGFPSLITDFSGTPTAYGVGLRDHLAALAGGGNPDFTLSASPSSLSLNPGASGTSTVTVTRTNGFSGSVAFSAGGAPAGVTAGLSPTSTAGTSTVLTLSAAAAAAAGSATITVTGTGGGLTHTTSVSLTVNGNGNGGGVTVTPVVNANGPWFLDQGVRLANPANLTSLSVTIVIQRTPGVSFSGQYNTVGGQVLQSNSSTSSTITYQFTLAAGQTLGPGTSWLFDAQASGSGTAHPTGGDTFSATYTTGGVSSTQTGHF